MPESRSHVVVAGHLCLDLSPALARVPSMHPGSLTLAGPMSVRPGGCVANTGLALARLGHHVNAVADVGDDEFADLLASALEAAGLSTRGLRRGARATSYSIVIEPPGADRSFWHCVGANADFDGSRVDLRGVDLLHVGYPSLLPRLSDDSGRALVRLFDRARRLGVVTSLDLAVVDPWASEVDWGRFLDTVLPLTDIVTPSVDDLDSSRSGRPRSDPLQEAVHLVDRGAAIAVVSDGTNGLGLASASSDRFEERVPRMRRLGGSWHGARLMEPARSVDVPLSSSGAGDACTAGFLAAFLEGAGPRASAERAADVAASHIAGRVPGPPDANRIRRSGRPLVNRGRPDASRHDDPR